MILAEAPFSMETHHQRLCHVRRRAGSRQTSDKQAIGSRGSCQVCHYHHHHHHHLYLPWGIRSAAAVADCAKAGAADEDEEEEDQEEEEEEDDDEADDSPGTGQVGPVCCPAERPELDYGLDWRALILARRRKEERLCGPTCSDAIGECYKLTCDLQAAPAKRCAVIVPPEPVVENVTETSMRISLCEQNRASHNAKIPSEGGGGGGEGEGSNKSIRWPGSCFTYSNRLLNGRPPQIAVAVSLKLLLLLLLVLLLLPLLHPRLVTQPRLNSNSRHLPNHDKMAPSSTNCVETVPLEQSSKLR